MTVQLEEKAIEYLEACKSACDLIKRSGRDQAYFYEGIGMPRRTFQRRLKQENWNPHDLIKLQKLLIT